MIQGPTQETNVTNIWLNPIIRTVLMMLLDRPLFELYMNGPAWIGWEGQDHTDICAAMTHVSAHEWIHNTAACDALIYRKFNALMVCVHFALYVTTIMLLCCCYCGMTCACACAVFGSCRKISRKMSRKIKINNHKHKPI